MVRTAPDDPLPTFPGYRTLARLGAGGMCVVYQVRERVTGRQRAVKVLDRGKSEAARLAFIREGQVLRRIAHPNVVRVVAVHEDHQPPWLVVELLRGWDLAMILARDGAIEPARAARIFADLASGLGAVHATGVRHRDLKPANVHLGRDGVPRLIDFGIAGAEPDPSRLGAVVGTGAYLPPEVFVAPDPERMCDTEVADVYALGQTLCEALAGRALYADGEGDRVLRAKLDQPFLDPRESGVPIPEGLAAVVRRATARDPDSRTPTARAFEDELRSWLASVAPEAPSPRRWWLLPALVALVTLAWWLAASFTALR